MIWTWRRSEGERGGAVRSGFVSKALAHLIIIINNSDFYINFNLLPTWDISLRNE